MDSSGSPFSRRTLIAAAITAVLFLLVLVVLGARMASGDDPVLGAQQRSAQGAAADRRDGDRRGVAPPGDEDREDSAPNQGYAPDQGVAPSQEQGVPPVQSGTS